MKPLLTLLFVCFSLTSLSKEPVLIKFVGAAFPKILEQNTDGSLSGTSIDIIRRASKKLKFNYTVSIYPWTRANQMVTTGLADVLIGPYKTLEREKFMAFTKNHFYEDNITLVTLNTSTLNWRGDMNLLVDKKVGVVRGWALGKKYESFSNKLQVTYADKTEKLLRMLKLKRLDVVIVHRRSFLDNIASDSINLKDFKMLHPNLSNQKGYFAFSLKSNLHSFMNNFNTFVTIPR